MSKDGGWRSNNPRWPGRAGRICAVDVRRAARVLRSQQDGPRHQDLRGAERGGCPHGAVARAAYATGPDPDACGRAVADVLKARDGVQRGVTTISIDSERIIRDVRFSMRKVLPSS